MSYRLLPLIAALLLCCSWTQAKPARIVSLNLCTDQLVLLLADRERIASLSYLSGDPRYNAEHAQVAGLHLNRGLAEEVMALTPDLILSSRFSATAAVNLLRRLGEEVTVLDFPADLDAGLAQIREVAALLGEPARGEALITAMQQSISQAQSQLRGEPRSALFLASNGITFGAGTLRDDFLTSLGWRNVATEIGIHGVASLNLEQILASEPELLIVDPRDARQRDLAHHLLSHPALKHYVERERVLTLADSHFECIGPGLAAAYERLAAALPLPTEDTSP